jgi:hypothetical protein
MDYELAKKLKEAGFPQADGLQFIEPNVVWDATAQSEFETPGTPPRSNWVKCPNLSELIEACGEKFDCLFYENGMWGAVGLLRGKGIKPPYRGTPDEAVALLWLALHPKKDAPQDTPTA